DRLGRKWVMLRALMVSAIASALLVAGDRATGLLFAGRLIAGIAGGAAFSSGVTWIKELSTATGSTQHGARRATIAMTAGFGAGPLVAGLLAQWVPHPMITPYLPHLALVVVAFVLLPRTQE